MRIKQNRLSEIFLRRKITEKDKEGSSYETWGAAVPLRAEVWPASGKIQAQQYGERLSYIRNVRIEGNYIVTTDAKGNPIYRTDEEITIREGDGLCLHEGPESGPDYRIVSIKPYRPMKIEAEKI